jgi:hypothetical protein
VLNSGGALGCNVSRFAVAWAPITKVIGQNSTVKVGGYDSFWSRVCKDNICGRLFCPIGHAELEFDIDLGRYRFSVYDIEKNKNWNHDKKLLHANAIIGRIQDRVIHQEQVMSR